MLLKTSFALVYMASVVSATFFPVMPKCWRKCAREAGVMCQWSDLPCLCKAANNGLFTKANTCACHACNDDEFGNDDKAKLDNKEFSFACKLAMTPLDQAVIDAGYHSATCEGTAELPPSPPPPPAPPLAPPPPPPVVPGYGWGSPPPAPPLAPGYGWGSPPPPKSPPSAAKPPVVSSPTATISVTVPASSKSAGYGYGIGSGAYDSTQIIQSTVIISPVPVSTAHNGKATTTTGTATSTVTGSKASSGTGTKTSAKPTAFTGAAASQHTEWAKPMFALVAALAYGIV